MLNREGAEAAYFDPSTSREGGAGFSKEGDNDALEIAMPEIWA
jgi:hypothetical protein